MNRNAPLSAKTPLTRDVPLKPGAVRLQRKGPIARTVPLLSPVKPAERITASRAGDFPAAESRVSAGTRNAARKTSSSGRAHGFPPAVAALLDERDPWCVYCGSPRDLQRHHRRLKGIGGDGRDHTQCVCNSVRLCADHHAWAHSGIGQNEARDEGLIIPRSTLEPFRVSVLVHTEEDRGGLTLWPLCDGTWGYAPPPDLIAAAVAAITAGEAAELAPSLRRGGQ